jgi:casein kinase II subunit alpha
VSLTPPVFAANLQGAPNIVQLYEVVRDKDTKTPCFVFEYVEAIGFRELQSVASDMDIRGYLFQLLQVGLVVGGVGSW